MLLLPKHCKSVCTAHISEHTSVFLQGFVMFLHTILWNINKYVYYAYSCENTNVLYRFFFWIPYSETLKTVYHGHFCEHTSVCFICFAMLLIRSWYLVNFDDFMINRWIHTRTLEGDGEKPSRYKNEGPLLIQLVISTLSADVVNEFARRS